MKMLRAIRLSDMRPVWINPRHIVEFEGANGITKVTTTLGEIILQADPELLSTHLRDLAG